jgi:NAD(P)-dependent dehydrogenase (short-subunit alcohol dehydrogenase family)
MVERAGRVEGKVAIVTGAARGLGAAYATILAQHGAAGMVTDVLEERGAKLTRELVGAGLTAAFRRLDVRDEAQWKDVVGDTRRELGGLHVLVNNAGIARMETVEEETLEGWNALMAINATGVFLGMKTCLPILRAQRSGSIINIASVFGLVGGPNLAAYHAAKSALIGLGRNVAVMAAPDGVRVNTVCPGPVLTEMAHEEERLVPGTLGSVLAITPMARAAEPVELAHAILFLAGDESSYITGIELPVDGGLRAGYQFRPPEPAG